MAFVTKTWKDRLVEFSGRRKLKNVSTNEEIIYDVSRSEGTIMQVGDQFSAENMNNLEQRIKTEFDSVNSSLNDGNMSFTVGEDGNPYATYKVGADTVTKKLGSGEIVIPRWEFNPTKGNSSGGAKVTFNVSNYSSIDIEALVMAYGKTTGYFKIYDSSNNIIYSNNTVGTHKNVHIDISQYETITINAFSYSYQSIGNYLTNMVIS